MASQVDMIKTLRGKKVADIKLEWENEIDDYYLDSIVFDDGTVLELWGNGFCAQWHVEENQDGVD